MSNGSALFKWLIFGTLLIGCQAKFLRIENEGELAKIEEYDSKVKVTALPVAPEVAQALEPQSVDSTVPTTLTPTEEELKKKKVKAKPTPTPTPKPKAVAKRQPDLEDSEGFVGRRPAVDPFWIGEKTVLALSYFGAKAGEMTMEVRPFVEVNGRKSYHLVATAKSSPFFSAFYSVDDYGETFVDYEDMIPYNFAVKVKESAQLREVRSFFDWKKMTASFWEKKVTKTKGTEEKKLVWGILPFSQNVFSAPFYLRGFKLTPGKVIQFRVADENRNMVVKAHVLRKEVLDTDIGKVNTVVIRPDIEMDGVFKPMGDVFFWLTDDDRKNYVQIEAKIRIGTIKAEITHFTPGVRP